MGTRRSVIFGLLALGALHAAVIFPGFFAPYDYAGQNRDLPFAPPARLHFVDAAGQFHLRPFMYPMIDRADGSGDYVEDRSQHCGVRFLVSGAPYEILGAWRAQTHLFGVDTPARLFLFGSDDFGRDQFSRMLYGARISVFAGLLATVVALLVGSLLGLVSGYYGRFTDAVVMRLVELFLALPWLYLLLAVRAALPLRIKTTDAFLLLISVVGFVGWARPARLIRGIVLSAKERNFVLAARAMGASNLQILRWHILPQTYGTLLTLAALLVPQFVLAEVTLSFLGLGVGEPIPSWGSLLAELQNYKVLTSYWWMYLPAAGLILLFLSYHWISTKLQEKFAMVAP